MQEQEQPNHAVLANKQHRHTRHQRADPYSTVSGCSCALEWYWSWSRVSTIVASDVRLQSARTRCACCTCRIACSVGASGVVVATGRVRISCSWAAIARCDGSGNEANREGGKTNVAFEDAESLFADALGVLDNFDG